MALKLKGSTSGFVAIDAPSVAGNNTLILPENTGSAHQILANDITAGVTTFTQVTVSRNGDLTVPGTISIGGTLTYEDVTSVDSVGIVTARSGVRINGGGLTIIGDTTGLKATGISTLVDVSARNITGVAATFTGNADVEGALIVGNGVASPLSGFSAHFHAAATSNRIQITTSNTGVTNADGAIIMVDSGSNMEILNRENTNIEFFTNNTQRLFIDNAGRLILGTNTARTFGGSVYAHLQLEGTTQQGSQFTITRNSNDTYSPNISLVKTRGTSNGSVTTVQDNDTLGTIQFRGADGSDVFAVASSIHSEVDGSPSDGTDMPGALVFATTADGAASPTERMRIASNGKIHMNYSGGTSAGNDRLNIMGGGDGITIARSTANASDGNILGNISFHSYMSGSYHANAEAKIEAIADSGQSGSNAPTHLDFYTKKTGVGPGASPAHQMRIWSGGNVQIYDGDLVVGTSGHGISFAATGQASGMSNELLDDYEEGSWTPAYGSSSVTSSTYTNTAGYYTLIGNTVFYTGRIQMSDSVVNGNPITMGGFPFTAASPVGKQGGFDITFIDNWYSGSSTTNAQVTFLNSGGTAYGYFYNGDGNTIAANATYDSARRTLHFKGHYFI